MYAVTQYDELDVVHPIVNKAGIGIQDGTIQDMLNIIEKHIIWVREYMA